MAPDPQCAAIAAAMSKKGFSYATLGNVSGLTEGRVAQICTAQDRPTNSEFKSLAQALGLTDNVPHTGVHATK